MHLTYLWRRIWRKEIQDVARSLAPYDFWIAPPPRSDKPPSEIFL